MLSLQKTKHSQLCSDLFKTNNGLNILHNNQYLFNELIKQSYDPELTIEAANILQQFKVFLKANQVKLLNFAVGFNHEVNEYMFSYELRSKIHNTQDLRVRGFNPDFNVPFAFFPSMFAKFFIDALNAAPISMIEALGRGE